MQDFEKLGVFYLGRKYDLPNGKPGEELILYDSKDLVTHAVCIGMTGSGKTGLCIGLLEEATIDNVPSIIIDPKGDMTNMLLTFPDLTPSDFRPWVNEDDAAKKGMSLDEYATKQASSWEAGLSSWGIGKERIRKFRENAEFVIYTPGSSAGLQISIMKSFTAPPPSLMDDPELVQERINTTVTGLLGLLGIEADPIRSREHILLSNIVMASWRKGEDLDLGALIRLIQTPPMQRIGMLELEAFYPKKERFALAMLMNNLLAAPGFELWMKGDPMDVDALLHTKAGKTKVSIFYIAHLSEAERMFFVSLLLNQIVGWMRTQSGTTSLRAIVYMDEVFGYLPPTQNPPSKLPLLTLLKQARAFGIGITLATQNPVDLDYKALSNAGTWFIGRLQTERDKMRVLEALQVVSASSGGLADTRYLDQTLSALGNRVFLMHNVHENAPVVFETRWAMSYLAGPLTRNHIKTLMAPHKTAPQGGAPTAAAGPSEIKPQAVAEMSASTATMNQRPLLPPDIPQYFIPVTVGTTDLSSSLVYEPVVLGTASTRFSNAKLGIDLIKEASYLAPITNEPMPVNWGNSSELQLGANDLQPSPKANAKYSDLPSAASSQKNYAAWQKDLAAWLYQSSKLELLRSPTFKIFSRAGEAERDFRVRLQQLAREKRDEDAEKLRKKYDVLTSRIDEKIKRAQNAVEQQDSQKKATQYQTAVSLGSAILGSFLGRKAATGVTRTARDIGRTMKESKDKSEAEKDLKALQAQRSSLEAEFQKELEAQGSKTNSIMEELEKVLIKPQKTGISIRFVALAWAPYWSQSDGKLVPAWMQPKQ